MRSFLYPLGLIATFLFGLRFLLQWFLSEKKKESVVPKSFWKISLCANFIMVIHSLIQLQFPVGMIQTMNGTIAWRNLDLMREKPKRLSTVFGILMLLFLCVIALFLIQGFTWMRLPIPPWSGTEKEKISFLWHFVGSFGLTLFASRFWVQWWLAEKSLKSHLGKSFWWMSLIGASIGIVYFIRLGDLVNILGYGTGVFPYLRNLFLIKKKTQSLSPAKNSLFFFAGEKSGDVLGGELLNKIRDRNKEIHLYGIGGEHMEQAGLDLMGGIEEFQVMGISGVIKKLPSLLNSLKKIKKRILRDNPKGVVLIDYADFNMKLAKSLRKGGYAGKIVHYVAPSIWVWRKGRIKELAKRLDLLLTILPFEKKYFAHTTLPVKYVGHPLIQAIEEHSYVSDWKERCGLDGKKPILSIFPGSRKSEIENNLLIQLKSVKQMDQSLQVALSIANPKLEPLITQIVKQSGFHWGKEIFFVPSLFRYELMRESHTAIATCGTVIFELGLLNTPTVVTYGLTHLNYFLGRYAFRIVLPAYSLVNIITKETVFPEFIHKELNIREIQIALNELIHHSAAREKAFLGCKKMQQILSKKNASSEAARSILEIVK